MLTRSCAIESRSRTVTVLSTKVSESTVIAIRCADLILPSVAPADRPGFIIEDLEMRPEHGRDALGDLRHTIAFDQRENGDFDRGQLGGEMQDHALRFLVVGVDQAGQ